MLTANMAAKNVLSHYFQKLILCEARDVNTSFRRVSRKVKAAMSNHHRSEWLLSDALDVQGVYFLMHSIETHTSWRKREGNTPARPDVLVLSFNRL